MPQRDFDIDSLAAFLHLSPQQVSRLADRGKIPCRKVQGKWVFSSAEVHHWLENKIGISDEAELLQMETVLQRNLDVNEEETIQIAKLLPLEAIATPLAAKTRGKVISGMTALAMNTGLLWDADKMAEAILAREEMMPTAMDNGVALMHPRRPMSNILAEPLLALGVTGSPIPFGGGRSGMTDIFFLICSATDRGHLRTLARLSRLISDDSLLQAIREAADSVEIYELIKSREQEMLT